MFRFKHKFINLTILYYVMKTTKKLINIGGNCSGVILDKALLVKLGIQNGDLVEIDFKKIE